MSEIKIDVRESGCPLPDDSVIRVDVCGQTCPVPLAETRRALRRAQPGDTVVVVGTHAVSKEEIPMAVKALGLELLGIEEADGVWTIRIRR